MTRAQTQKYFLWAFLAVPAALWLVQARGMDPYDWEELLHPTGELSARLLIVALALTPLVQLFPTAKPLRWLIRHRRALGVAAFGYAALHTGLYIGARFGPGPRDGLMTGAHARFGWKIWKVRTGVEVTVLAIGWLLGGTVGFGTIAFALLIGPMVGVTLPLLRVPEPTRPPAPVPS